MMPQNALLSRLNAFTNLDADDRTRLDALCRTQGVDALEEGAVVDRPRRRRPWGGHRLLGSRRRLAGPYAKIALNQNMRTMARKR